MQLDANVLTTIIAVVALGLAAYGLFKMQRAGTPITNEVVVDALADATLQAQALAEVAETAVQAAEQLYRTGKIERNARLDYAFDYIEKWLPDIDSESILTAIESSVLALNAMLAVLPKKTN